MNLVSLSDAKVMQEGERVAIIYEDRRITNMEMMGASKRLAAALSALGVKRGDRVILQMPNCPEVLQAFEAAWRIGAAIVPINWLVGEEETAYIYRDSGAEVVISSIAYLAKIEAARSRAPGVRHVILIEEKVPAGYLSCPDLISGFPENAEIVETADDELAAIIYTAGTTGRPKGVMHTHGSLYANAKMQYESIQVEEGIVALCVLPLCHSYGIAVMNNGLFRKVGPPVLLNTFDLTKLFEAIAKYRPAVMMGVPTMFVYMLLYAEMEQDKPEPDKPEPDKIDLSSLKYVLCGAAPLALETWKRFKELFGIEICEGWGLTEAGANNSVNPLMGLKKVGSIGIPMKGTGMKIFDNEGREVPQGVQGEIVLSGPMLMKGYWNQPEETARVLRNGWLYTGDVGYVDADGYFWITDRKKDLIIKGGENISPRGIEEVLLSHPQVLEAAVVGMKDPKYGEEIRAYLVLKPGEAAGAEEIREHCRRRLPGFFVPKEIVFLEAMPKNLLGKIMKRELREQLIP